jgi:hypothetical protein
MRLPCRDRLRRSSGDGTDLLQQCQQVVEMEELGDSAIFNAEHLDASDLNMVAGRLDAEQLARMGATVGVAAGGAIPFDDDLVHLDAVIGDAVEEGRQQHDRRIPSVPDTRDRGVNRDIVGDEFTECSEIPSIGGIEEAPDDIPDLFGIAG